jgi:hypothetical protein
VAEVDVPLSEGPPHTDGRQHRTLGVILMRKRGPEQRHESVSQELVDRPFVTVDLSQGQLEKAIQEGVHRLGSQAFGQGCGVAEVAEKDGDLFALAFDCGPAIQDLLGEMWWGVPVGTFEWETTAQTRRDLMRTLRTELRSRRDLDPALGTRQVQTGATRGTQFCLLYVFALAPGTPHSRALNTTRRERRVEGGLRNKRCRARVGKAPGRALFALTLPPDSFFGLLDRTAMRRS